MNKKIFSLLIAVVSIISSCWAKESEFVDLGLSVEWATCNLGANVPEEKGNYYSWGETSAKKMYKWSTYTHCKGSIRSLSKYCTKNNFGTADSITRLSQSDDAAYLQNKEYRMPTKEEYDELLKNCTWEWSDNHNGAAGYIVTSKKEGYTDKSIFFPASGRFLNSEVTEAKYGFYWTSDLNPFDPGAAYILYWNSELLSRSECSRFYGAPIRAVKECKKKAKREVVGNDIEEDVKKDAVEKGKTKKEKKEKKEKKAKKEK